MVWMACFWAVDYCFIQYCIKLDSRIVIFPNFNLSLLWVWLILLFFLKCFEISSWHLLVMPELCTFLYIFMQCWVLIADHLINLCTICFGFACCLNFRLCLFAILSILFRIIWRFLTAYFCFQLPFTVISDFKCIRVWFYYWAIKYLIDWIKICINLNGKFVLIEYVALMLKSLVSDT